ncbi:hypothetical protein D3C76_1742400 [compost metagenome]
MPRTSQVGLDQVTDTPSLRNAEPEPCCSPSDVCTPNSSPPNLRLRYSTMLGAPNQLRPRTSVAVLMNDW